MTADGCRVSFWGDEKALKPDKNDHLNNIVNVLNDAGLYTLK